MNKANIEEEHFNKAIKLYQTKEYEEAREIFIEILNKNTSNRKKILYFIALIAINCKNYEEGIEAIEKALAISQANNSMDKIKENEKINACLYNNLGIIYEKKGEHDIAILNFNKAIELDSKFPDAHYNKGSLLVKLKDFDNALESLNKAIELSPNFINALINRCLLKSTIGLFPGAIRDAYKINQIQESTETQKKQVVQAVTHCVAMELVSKLNFLENNKNIEDIENESEEVVKKIDIVTFYVPQESNSVIANKGSIKNSWDFFLKSFYDRAKITAPSARIILLTTNDAQLPDDLPPYKIIRFEASSDGLMYTRLLCQINYIRSRGEKVASFILDLDVLINKLPWHLLKSKIEVALTTRAHMPPLNAGVLYFNIGEGPLRFLELTLKIYQEIVNLAPKTNGIKNIDFKKWWGDQISMCGAAGILHAKMLIENDYLINGIIFKLLECDLYNYSPKKIDSSEINLNLIDKYFIHFKGNINEDEMTVIKKYISNIK
jgi:tetratricopeptide (TPR) repeat protein